MEDVAPPVAVVQQMAMAKELLEQAATEQELAGRLARDAVRQLTDELGLTLREAAEVPGISHQRVAQLHGRAKRPA